MKFLVVVLVFYIAQTCTDAIPANGRAQIVEVINPNKAREISLKLQPPDLPHDHHHHHHQQPSTTKVPVTSATKVPDSSTETKKPQVDIVRQEYENFPDGGYRFVYETSDGQTREEVGYFSDGENLLNVRGSYSYIGDDGKLVKVNYVADENGYRQSEGVLPPPAAPLPPHVVASLAG